MELICYLGTTDDKPPNMSKLYGISEDGIYYGEEYRGKEIRCIGLE